MLSEDHYSKGKSFLNIYSEAVNTLKDIAEKTCHQVYTQEFYDIMNQSIKNNQIVVDDQGNLKKGNGIRASFWYRTSDLSQEFVLRKVKQDKEFLEFYKNLQDISTGLDKELSLLRDGKKLAS